MESPGQVPVECAAINVSVVVPARNAAPTLRRQLDALDRQTFGCEFLVVVVDNGSTDGTDQVATSYRPEHYQLRVVREPRVGINVARNTGIATAPDGMVLLCDADDEVAEDWLATMASALRPGTWVAGTLDYARLNSPRTRRVWNAPARSVHRPTDPYVDDTKGCNCGFTRAMWVELGGFDERLSGTGGDENEMFMRAYHAGYRPRHVSTAIVSYRLRPGLGSMVRQRYRQGRNQIRDESAARAAGSCRVATPSARASARCCECWRLPRAISSCPIVDSCGSLRSAAIPAGSSAFVDHRGTSAGNEDQRRHSRHSTRPRRSCRTSSRCLTSRMPTGSTSSSMTARWTTRRVSRPRSSDVRVKLVAEQPQRCVRGPKPWRSGGER